MYYLLEGDKVINKHVEYRILGKSVKTTVNIDEDLWKKFSIKVIQKHGGRKKNEVIEELIQKYVKSN